MVRNRTKLSAIADRTSLEGSKWTIPCRKCGHFRIRHSLPHLFRLGMPSTSVLPSSVSASLPLSMASPGLLGLA